MSGKLANLGKFPLGANNVAPDTALPEGFLLSVTNADVDDAGNIIKKSGHVKVYDGDGCHSLYKDYFVEKGKIKQIDTENNVTEIEDVSPNKFLAWDSLFNNDYYSDGIKGYIVGRGEWGVPKPAAPPQLTKTSGGQLDAGTYQVAICYRNEYGELSGATRIISITVGQGYAILCSSLPKNHTVVIYVSQPDGVELFLNTETNSSSVAITQSRANTGVLQTEFLDVVPGGHIVRFHKARMYVAQDTILWFSREFNYGLNDKSKDFFQFPEKITIVQPVENGLYIVADKTYFLAGAEPDKMNLRVVSDNKGIPGTGYSVGAKVFGKAADYIVGFWYSERGAILGLPDGSLELLTEDKFAIKSDLQSGCTTLNETDGFKRMITSMSNTGQDSNLGYDLQLTSKIIRNGVVIEE